MDRRYNLKSPGNVCQQCYIVVYVYVLTTPNVNFADSKSLLTYNTVFSAAAFLHIS